MKLYLGILIIGCWLVGSTPARAAEFSLKRVTVTTKYTEDKSTQNWLAVAAKGKGDWLTTGLSGKFYLKDLADNYEDSSAAGTDDLFSNVRADFAFGGWGQGFKGPVSYKWNKNYQIHHYGIGYERRPWKTVKLGFSYAASLRKALESSCKAYNYSLGLAKILFKYQPERWSYKLDLTRSDKVFPNFEASSSEGANASRYNTNFTALKYLVAQDLSYQWNERLKLGLSYSYSNTDYYQDRLRDEINSEGIIQTKGKKEGKSNKFNFTGNYQLNEGWKLSGSYGLSDTTGYNGDYASDSIRLEGKYTVRGQWWLAAKLHLTDLSYSHGYQPEDDAATDDDPDYKTRFQQTLAVEYFRKHTAFTYNFEVFAKHYDYESAADHAAAGVIATLSWEWLHMDWSLEAAPNGSLSSSKAKYRLKTEYQF
jgi:hypothetical protein